MRALRFRIFLVKCLFIIGISVLVFVHFKSDKNKYADFEAINLNYHFNSSKQNNSKENVLCMVLTTENNILTRGVSIWDTWGPGCDQLVFTCNCPHIINLKKLIGWKILKII